MNKTKQITMHFGGGCLFLKCRKCRKDIGSKEVDFPGTPKQQKKPREELEVIKKEHLAKCSEREDKLVEALQWCGGSEDFNEGGKAREGWLKICRPLLEE